MSHELPLDGTVVVAGASLAGLRAAQALRDGGFRGRLVMVGEETHPLYDRPPLSKQVLAGTWSPERIVLAGDEQLAKLGLELRLGCRATSLDAASRRVELDDGSAIDADGVVVATGSRPRLLRGVAAEGPVGVLRTLEDAERLRRRIDEVGEGCRLVVVGAGFIGSEVAATCSGLGCAVTVLEALPTPLAPALGERVGAALGALHTRRGVDLRTSAVVERVERFGGRPPDPGDPGGATRDAADPGGAVSVVLSGGAVVPADVVVVGIGVVPNTGWLEGSGLDVSDGVLCDEALLAAEGVAAAGDLARWRWRHRGHAEDEEVLRIEHWELASQMGAAAARSLLAGRDAAEPFDPVPYFWSDQYGLKIQVLGHPDPTDDVEVVLGSLEAEGGEDERFVAVFGRAGRLSAALAVSRPRQLMAFRPLLVDGASFDEARSLLERS